MRSRLLLLALVSLMLVGCDHATKTLALSNFKQVPVELFFGALTLTYTENRDMAFGLLGSFLSVESRFWVLTGIKSFAVVLGAAYLCARSARGSLRELVAITFVVSGAAGNLIDRATRGFVVDFLRVPYWPVFNVADIAIVVGYGLLFFNIATRTAGSVSNPKS